VAGDERLCLAVADIDLTVRQVVVGGPQGEVTYALRLAHGTASVTTDAVDADVEVVQDYETAVAVSQGVLTPATAFAAGRMKLGGRIGRLIRDGDATAGLG